MASKFSSDKVWLVIYVVIALSYIYIMVSIAHLPYTIVKYLVVVSLCFAIIEYYINKAFINNILNIFLFVSVLSTITLMRQGFYKFVLDETVIVLYVTAIFAIGVLWILSFSVILESNRLKYHVIDKGIMASSIIALLLLIMLYSNLHIYGSLEYYEALIFAVPPTTITVLIVLFDVLLFRYILRVLSREQRKERSLLYIDLFIHILYSFVLLIPLISTSLLLVTVKPGEKNFIALSILSSYFITALIVSLIAKIYVDHGVIIDYRKPPRETYITESLAHFYRMRYISALILLFNHIEASGRQGLEVMNTRASAIVYKGAEIARKLLKRLFMYKKALNLAKELDNINVVLVKLPRLSNNALKDKDIINSIKSIESNLLKAYQLIIEGKHPSNYIKTVRGNVKKIISILWKQGNEEYKSYEEILETLNIITKNPEAIKNLVEIRPLLLRDVRNYMVHGRLTREYFYYNNKIVRRIELFENYDNLFLLYTTILSYTNSLIEATKNS